MYWFGYAMVWRRPSLSLTLLLLVPLSEFSFYLQFVLRGSQRISRISRFAFRPSLFKERERGVETERGREGTTRGAGKKQEQRRDT